MTSNKTATGIEIKALLSTLWIFVLLNVLFRDIHELFRPGFLAEMMTGTVNGVQMTEGTLLLAGVLLEIPLGMVILSRVLKDNVNRWANIIAGAISIAFVIGNRPRDLDDMFFAIMEIASLALIFWFAWKWPDPAHVSSQNYSYSE